MDDVDETLQRALVEYSEKENQENEIERVAGLYPNRLIELAEDVAERIVCPNCGEKAGVDILYGYPSRVMGGNTIVGGCIVRQESPMYGCLQCSHRWGLRD
jgi:hypothetical protein